MSAFKNNVSHFFWPKNAVFTKIIISSRRMVILGWFFAAILLLVNFLEKNIQNVYWVANFAAISILSISRIFATYTLWVLKQEKWLTKLQFLRYKASKNPKGAKKIVEKVVFFVAKFCFWKCGNYTNIVINSVLIIHFGWNFTSGFHFFDILCEKKK